MIPGKKSSKVHSAHRKIDYPGPHPRKGHNEEGVRTPLKNNAVIKISARMSNQDSIGNNARPTNQFFTRLINESSSQQAAELSWLLSCFIDHMTVSRQLGQVLFYSIVAQHTSGKIPSFCM
jgi:hypothetical protein